MRVIGNFMPLRGYCLDKVGRRLCQAAHRKKRSLHTCFLTHSQNAVRHLNEPPLRAVHPAGVFQINREGEGRH